MRRVALGACVVALIACGRQHTTEEPMARPDPCPPGNEPATAAEVELHLALAVQPFGDGPNVREMAAASCWLLQHADAAYPAVEAKVRGDGGPGHIELLGRFDRSASTPLLVELLGSMAAPTRRAAAAALSRASDPAAAEALRAAAADASPTVAAAALEGLRDRRDAGDCAAVTARLADPDVGLRFAAVEAAGTIGCLDAAALRHIAATDADPDVRAVASELAKPRR